MRRIAIMRHGIAEPFALEDSDYYRNLTEKGKEEIAIKATQLMHFFDEETIILHSSARRTTQTAEILAQVIKLNKANIIAEDSIYKAESEELLDILHWHCEFKDKVILVGHNPSVSVLISELLGTNTTLEPGNFKVFDCEITDWNNLSLETCKLIG
jgi:phosphohistidine phosphatase